MGYVVSILLIPLLGFLVLWVLCFPSELMDTLFFRLECCAISILMWAWVISTVAGSLFITMP